MLAVFSIAPYFVWAGKSPLELTSVSAANVSPPWTAFSALRAYAMSNRTWPIAILVFLLSITTACYNIVRDPS